MLALGLETRHWCPLLGSALSAGSAVCSRGQPQPGYVRLRAMRTKVAFVALFVAHATAQTPVRVPKPSVPLQPLAQQARRLDSTLSYLGQPLAPADRRT